VVARVERGGAAVWAGGVVPAGAGRVVEVHRSEVELEGATVGQRGGRRRWRSVDQGVAVGIGMVRGEAEAGREQMTKVEKRELVGGALPL
jgi:hypothetical protein